jgi:hypothetical protein
VRAAEDVIAHLPDDPFDDFMKSYLCHILILAFLVMMFRTGAHPPLESTLGLLWGNLTLCLSCAEAVLILCLTDCFLTSGCRIFEILIYVPFPHSGRLLRNFLLPHYNRGVGNGSLQRLYREQGGEIKGKGIGGRDAEQALGGQ